MQQPLFCLLDNDDTLAGARYGTCYSDYVVFNVDKGDLQVFDGYLLVTHLAGHLLTLENLLRIHRTDGTGAAIRTATVGLATAVEVVALDGASPTFTF